MHGCFIEPKHSSCFNLYRNGNEVTLMEEYILRLVRLGISTPKAWSICFKYFRSKDFNGLEEFIAKREEALHKIELEKV